MHSHDNVIKKSHPAVKTRKSSKLGQQSNPITIKSSIPPINQKHKTKIPIEKTETNNENQERIYYQFQNKQITKIK